MSDLGSLIFYIVSFFLSSCLYFFYNKSSKKIFLILAFVIPMLIGGLRYYVGTDYELYITLHRNNSDVDFGFQLINSVARYFNSYQVMFFIYNFLTLLFVFLGLRSIDKKYRTFAYFCFLFLFYTSSLNIIRQMLAVSIVFYSYKYIVNKKFFKFLICVLVATCFHNTAILFVFLYILLNNTNKKIRILSLIILLLIVLRYEQLIIYLGNISILSKFVRYQDYTGTKSFNNYSFYLDLLIMFYILLFRKKLTEYDKDNKVYIYMYVISLILMLTGFSNPAVKRIANYFKMSEIILLPQIPHVCNNSKDKLLNYVLISVYLIGSFIVFAYVLRQADIIPYNFVEGIW